MSVDSRMADRREGLMPVASAVVLICGSSYFSMLVGILRSVLVMRMLGPTFQGVRRIVDMITKYLFNAHLGVLHGASKQLPIYLGQDDAEKVEEVETAGISWTIGLTLIASLGMVFWGLSNPTGQRTTAIAIVIGGGWLLVQQTTQLYRTMIRAWGHFALLGMAGGVDTITTFIFTLLGAWKFGVIGAMTGTLVAWCATLLVYSYYCPLAIRFRFDWRAGWQLACIGIPIAAVIFSDTLLRTVDGAIIVTNKNYAAYNLGLYSLATQMAQYLYAIPESAGFVIWPRILEAFGAKSGDASALRRQILLPTLVSGGVMPLIAGLAFVFLPPMVALVVPSFMRATLAAQVLSMGSVFLALPMASNSLLIAQNREYQVVITKCLGAGVTAGASFYLVHHQMGLEYLAAAAGAGYAVTAIVSLALVLHHYTNGLLDSIRTYFRVYLPFFWACGALYASHELARYFTTEDPRYWSWAVCRGGLFVAIMIPVLVAMNRQTNLLQEFGSLLTPMAKPKENEDRD